MDLNMLKNELLNESSGLDIAVDDKDITDYPDGRIERCENVKEVVRFVQYIEKI